MPLLRRLLLSSLLFCLPGLSACGACSTDSEQSVAESPKKGSKFPGIMKGKGKGKGKGQGKSDLVRNLRESKGKGKGKAAGGWGGGVMSSPEEQRPLSPELTEARVLIEANESPEKRAAAAAILETALAAKPNDADALYWRGRLKSTERAFEQARLDFQAAKVADPAFLGPLRWEAATWIYQRKFAEAMPLLNQVIERAPEDPQGWFSRGQCNYQLGHFPEALTDAQKACALGSESACRTAPRIERRMAMANGKAAPEEGSGADAPAPAADAPAGEAAAQ
jgi:tetratricopeptide (TPR) repeat protein